MFCHECDYCIGPDWPFVMLTINERPAAVCLECASQLNWLSHGQPIYLGGHELPEAS